MERGLEVHATEFTYRFLDGARLARLGVRA